MRKIKKINETHAKIEGEPTMLDQIFGGYNELAKYGTLNEEEYSKQVTEMTRTDLENHARRIGVVIVESSERLKDKLIKEFRNYTSLLKKPNTVAKIPPTLSEKVRKILSEGK